MKRLVIDLDGTLTLDTEGVVYEHKQPNLPVIEKLKEYKAAGFDIIIATSRNMRTFDNSVGKINAFTLPIIIACVAEGEFDVEHAAALTGCFSFGNASMLNG